MTEAELTAEIIWNLTDEFAELYNRVMKTQAIDENLRLGIILGVAENYLKLIKIEKPDYFEKVKLRLEQYLQV